MTTPTSAPPGDKAPAAGSGGRRSRLLLGLVVTLVILLGACALSLAVGANALPLGTVWQALTAYDPADPNHLVIVEKRVPRTLIGLTAGLALGVAGAVMQGLVRNPIAEPGLLGVNSGAALFVVVAITLFGVHQVSGYVWFAFLGAAVTGGFVYGVASFGRDGATPVKLVLSGAAVTAAIASVVTAMLLADRTVLDAMRFWQVGSLAARGYPVFWETLPGIVLGLILALAVSGSLNGLALGEDVARGLGYRVGLTRGAGALALVLLCGSATAATGPIAFVGLVIPHVVRRFAGQDHRWVIPYAALAGPVLLLGGDVIGRVVVRPGELQVGVVTALVGGLLFIAVVRQRRRTSR
ncbi:FecCD family ABC transporter permease [Rhizohabitans arisaemae]|uniref:FecCD family ABC transporter permease n=1 Tax=Rhizohabitans arisaemae TaxID=2720610 RepID=UPI0024B1BE40|nr:iron chelate uptake ABC transporter family permease subunit [Rhizohabitans arisaemae]